VTWQVFANSFVICVNILNNETLGKDQMKKIVPSVITILVIAGLIAVAFVNGINLNDLQKETLLILAIICGASALYCFVVGEITHNNSQMDKLWSILPIVYLWVIAVKSGMSVRIVVMAVLVSIWGLRLTANFASRGAYSLKFWSGEEDYRWSVLRQDKTLRSPVVWAVFDLLFISIYQNALVLAICLPALAVMPSGIAFTVMDYVAAALSFLFIIYETIADREQSAFQKKKHQLLSEGKDLKSLPAPYDKGFNTHGLWAVSRHPNYFAEQSFWVSIYLFTIGASVTHYAIFNWTMVGCLLLIMLFTGSSSFAEKISSSKYPEYSLYQSSVSKYFPIPWKKYRTRRESTD
jgi:steroid 5-alpha reductase family enzyme